MLIEIPFVHTCFNPFNGGLQSLLRFHDLNLCHFTMCDIKKGTNHQQRFPVFIFFNGDSMN